MNFIASGGKKFVEGISFESLVWCFQMGFTSKSQQNISDQNKHFVLKEAIDL